MDGDKNMTPPSSVEGGVHPPGGAARPLPAVWTAEAEAVTCPGCGAAVTSKVAVDACTVPNWAICLIVGCWCVFIPACGCNCMSNYTHRCPNCAYALGAKRAC